MIQPDEIIRSDRKTLAIAVDGFGRLIVRAPKRCDRERIFAFIRQKESWILRQKSKMQRAGTRLPPENLDGYVFKLLGRDCKIRLISQSTVRYDADGRTLFLPEKNAKERLIKWLRENAARIFTEATAQTAVKMGVSYRSVTVSCAKSKWGSCSHDDKIRYSYRLLYAPKEVVEYVVTHELAHTKHKNHSKAFWEEVEKYQPDWKSKRKWLKANGYLMEIF